MSSHLSRKLRMSLHPRNSLKRSKNPQRRSSKNNRNKWRNKRAKSQPNSLDKSLQPKLGKKITIHQHLKSSIKPRKNNQLLLRTAQTRLPKARIKPKTALIQVQTLTLNRTKLNPLLLPLAQCLDGSLKLCSIKRKDPSMYLVSLILTIKPPKMMTQHRKSPNNKRAIIDTLKIIVILITKEIHNQKTILIDSNRIKIRQGSLLKQRKRVKRLFRKKPRLLLKQKQFKKKRVNKQLRKQS